MNRNFVIPAIVLIALAVFGYYYFQFMSHENVPGENNFRMANKYLQDGEYDEAIELEHTKQMASLIPGSTLILMPNLSHFAMWQDPKAFNTAVLKYLDMK